MKSIYWNKGCKYLSKKDKILKSLINNYPYKCISLNKNHFHCLINSIIGQQISVSAANSINKKFFSLKKTITPKNINELNNLCLKNIGLSKQKILYIKNLSGFFLDNKIFFKKIDSLNDEIIKKTLLEIKGVGPWTVDMFLIFSLGRLDIFPRGDLGFLKAISISYKKKFPLSDKFLDKLNNKWSPYSSIATLYLWRSLDPKPISY